MLSKLSYNTSFIYTVTIQLVIVLCALTITLKPVNDIYISLFAQDIECETKKYDQKEQEKEGEKEERESKMEEKLFQTDFHAFNAFANKILIKSNNIRNHEEKLLLDSFISEVNSPPHEGLI